MLHVLPGGEEGWITESWNRPNYFLDAASRRRLDRSRISRPASPVTSTRNFPAKYRNALFVLDWTFGRVLTVPLVTQGATFAPQQAVNFLTAEGEHGFAPTDVEVGVDGSLYVCVGGRGTHGDRVSGDLYRRRCRHEDPRFLLKVNDQTPAAQQLAACLEPTQPQSSWARSRWVPLATRLGARAFRGSGRQ